MQTSPTDRVGRAVGTAGVALGVLFAAFVFVVVFYDGRQDIDLDRWAEQQDDGYGVELMPNPRWATDELCDDELLCVQAVTSDTLTMYRFARREHAVAAAESFGENGYLTGWIAVRYEAEALSDAERTAFQDSIACINTWVGEQGQDC